MASIGTTPKGGWLQGKQHRKIILRRFKVQLATCRDPQVCLAETYGLVLMTLHVDQAASLRRD